MSQVILLSLTASLNPTLVGATTVMLMLDKPKRLMLGYLLGAYMTSITLGLVIVFSLSGSSTTNTTQNTISPAVDIALGGILLVVAYVLHTLQSNLADRHKRESHEWTLAGVIGGGLGLWAVFALLRRRMLGEAAGEPVALKPGLLAARFGSPAGCWVYDRLFLTHRAAVPQTPPPPRRRPNPRPTSRWTRTTRSPCRKGPGRDRLPVLLQAGRAGRRSSATACRYRQA